MRKQFDSIADRLETDILDIMVAADGDVDSAVTLAEFSKQLGEFSLPPFMDGLKKKLDDFKHEFDDLWVCVGSSKYSYDCNPIEAIKLQLGQNKDKPFMLHCIKPYPDRLVDGMGTLYYKERRMTAHVDPQKRTWEMVEV